MRFLGFMVAASLLVVACGGKLDSDADASVDAGGLPKGDSSVVVDTGIDVSMPPSPDSGPKPPPPLCSGKQGGGTQGSDGSCSSEQKWSCSDKSAYSIICACPGDATCSCFKNTILVKKVPSGSVCPGCGNVSGLAKACGFPE